MPVVSLSLEHGQTWDQARDRLELAVGQMERRFGTLVQRIEWAADRNEVKIFGPGVQIELRVDARAVHVTGDVPLLAQLLGGRLVEAVRGILQQTFHKELPRSTDNPVQKS